MGVVAWDTIVVCVLRGGCRGTCLWEWLAIGVPKWLVPR